MDLEYLSPLAWPVQCFAPGKIYRAVSFVRQGVFPANQRVMISNPYWEQVELTGELFQAHDAIYYSSCAEWGNTCACDHEEDCIPSMR